MYLKDEKNNSITILEGNGDFKSNECIEILKNADIVVTNPPFSLFREYINILVNYNKQFLIIGNCNIITDLKFFSLMQENKLWLGYTSVKEFIRPDGSTQSFGNVCWFTNLDVIKRHEKLESYKEYNTDEYPKYDNYDAINVNKIAEIPVNYFPCWYTCKDAKKCKFANTLGNDVVECKNSCNGLMGVPISIMNIFNPEQFELIGLSSKFAKPVIIEGKVGKGRFYINNKRLYERILVRRKY